MWTQDSCQLLCQVSERCARVLHLSAPLALTPPVSSADSHTLLPESVLIGMGLCLIPDNGSACRRAE
jgi:hypothetical protein